MSESAMPDESNFKLTIAFDDPDLSPDELEEQAQNLFAELQEIDEIETVTRVLDPKPPEGSKAWGGALVGRVIAQVQSENTQKVLGFLQRRLSNQAIEMTVEGNGKKLSVKARNPEELNVAIQAAKDFIGDLPDSHG